MEGQSGGKVAKVRRARGKWTPEQRAQMVVESRQPGASVREVARRHDVRTALLSAWRRKAAGKVGESTAVGFAAVQLSSAPSEGVIEIDLRNRCVRVRGIVDGAMLREVLAAAR